VEGPVRPGPAEAPPVPPLGRGRHFPAEGGDGPGSGRPVGVGPPPGWGGWDTRPLYAAPLFSTFEDWGWEPPRGAKEKEKG
jgi:hypothetical protein